MKTKLFLIFVLLICAFPVKSSTWIETGNYDISWYDDISSVFELSTAKELAGVAYLCNSGKIFTDKTIKLTADVDLGNYDWDMIDNFNGIFNGDGHIIKNIRYNYQTTHTGTYYSSFIKTLQNAAIIENTWFQNISFSVTLEYGYAYVGGITCFNYGTINNCIVEGSVSAKFSGSTSAVLDPYYVGGVAAYNYGLILNSVHDGSVESMPTVHSQFTDAFAGGFTSINEGNIINCINYGSVYSRVGLSSSSWKGMNGLPYAYSGGICGKSTGNINNAINLADITAISYQLASMPSTNAYASGITATGDCINCYYSSGNTITAPSIVNTGILLSPNQIQNKSYDFTSLLNQNLSYFTNYDVVYWANSATTNNNIPFLLNCFAIKMNVDAVTQNAATFTANPADIFSSVIVSKGFEYKKIVDTDYIQVYCDDKFSVSLTNLELYTNYVVRPFVYTIDGNILRGDDVYFSTSQIKVETQKATNITANTATLNGFIQGGITSIQSQGFLWKAANEQNYHIVFCDGQNLQYQLTNLLPNTMYSYQAFVLTLDGNNYYGDILNFSTRSIDISITNHISDRNSIYFQGNLNINIETEITIEFKMTTENSYKRTFCETQDNGNFEFTLTELLPNTSYDCRVFIIYNNAYIYSQTGTYSTLNVLVQTLAPVLNDVVTLRGEVIGDMGLGSVGFEYRDVNYPNIIESNFVTSSLIGTTFTSIITEVENGVEYKYRAYYSVEENVTYGNWVNFTPENSVPTFIEQTENEVPLRNTKILCNGQLLIIHEGKTYTIMGQEM